jgi:hypothetical protein
MRQLVLHVLLVLGLSVLLVGVDAKKKKGTLKIGGKKHKKHSSPPPAANQQTSVLVTVTSTGVTPPPIEQTITVATPTVIPPGRYSKQGDCFCPV